MRLIARGMLLAAVMLAPTRAPAAVLDDLLIRNYTIAAATRLPGLFTGCVRTQRLTFTDGSAFACSRTVAQTGFEPRVYILQLRGQPPSVVLVGSHVLAGQLLRLHAHDYAVPLRMNADPLAGGPPPPSAAIPQLGAIPSINTVTQQQSVPLSQQQDRLPILPPKNRPSR